ncbi:MAG: hypothetical protein JXQ23_08080 [Clostridia bacterium]|nr:hypothetical protein [Clostridia bacterium]
MKVIMKSVEMICVSNQDGKISPIKYKYVDKSEQIHIVKIDKILERNEEKLAGNRMYVYKVMSVINEAERVYEMKYELATCKWYIYKM